LVTSVKQVFGFVVLEAALPADGGVDADLEKKPRMLCCLPVDIALPTFLGADGVFAGVRAGIEEALLPAIVTRPKMQWSVKSGKTSRSWSCNGWYEYG
jgi:hypothetical protein